MKTKLFMSLAPISAMLATAIFAVVILAEGAFAENLHSVGEKVYNAQTQSYATIMNIEPDGSYTVRSDSGEDSGQISSHWTDYDFAQSVVIDADSAAAGVVADQNPNPPPPPPPGPHPMPVPHPGPFPGVYTCNVQSSISVGHVGIFKVVTRQGQNIGTFYDRNQAENFARNDRRCYF